MSGAAPAVSIIVPTYNRGELLALALQTILLQDVSDYEVWVVGDACTDDSGAVVEALRDKRFRWHNLERNHRAPHAACNEGLSRARGEIVAYLCHDDLWFPWHLSRLLAQLHRSGADLAYDMAAEIDPPQTVACRGEQQSFDRVIHIHPSNVAHRRLMAEGRLRWQDPYEVGWATDAYFLLSAHRAGCRFSFLEQLGSINCGSGTWNTYAANEFPQHDFLRRMRADPRGLAGDLLLANSARAARQQEADGYLSAGAALRRVARHCAWWAYHAWGGERAPVKQLRRWYFARKRRKYNRTRGLPF